MLRSMVSVFTVVSLLFFDLANADVFDKLSVIKSYDRIRCGVIDDVPEMSEKQGQKYVGYDVDFCADLAKALSVTNIDIVPVADTDQFKAINFSQSIDVLVGHVKPSDALANGVEVSIPYFSYRNDDIRVMVSPQGDRKLIKFLNQFIWNEITSGRQKQLHNLWTGDAPPDLSSKTCGWQSCPWITN